MRTVVTGAAGFIGSHLTESLLRHGHEVVGVDCLTEHYPAAQKRANLDSARHHPRFELCTDDLARVDGRDLLDGAEVVFHLAARPGVRTSWADRYAAYEEANVLVTQRLLEAARAVGLPRFVYASSSSIYGNARRYPTAEDELPMPFSPYGVTKLAGEHLCRVYAENFGLSTVALRLFTVFGPRQRPDMAMHRMIEATMDGEPFPVYGARAVQRDFTYVADVVAAFTAAAAADLPDATVLNVAGGAPSSLDDVITTVGRLVGRAVPLQHGAEQAGDVLRTGASTDRAAALLGWRPTTDLADGLAAQIAWHRARR